MLSERLNLGMAAAAAAYPRMSIYRSKIKCAVGHADARQAVTHGAVDTSGRCQIGPDPARDWSHLRKVKPVNHILPASIKWLASLPKEVRPWALVRQYPRIANFLALEWSRPVACAAYFDSLLVDHRHGKRQGFPPDVHRELRTLRDNYHRQHVTLAV
jgi:hypothetical protein